MEINVSIDNGSARIINLCLRAGACTTALRPCTGTVVTETAFYLSQNDQG